MKLDTIGKNIRKFRLAKKLRQEDLAERTGLTANYSSRTWYWNQPYGYRVCGGQICKGKEKSDKITEVN